MFNTAGYRHAEYCVRTVFAQTKNKNRYLQLACIFPFTDLFLLELWNLCQIVTTRTYTTRIDMTVVNLLISF